MDPLEIDEYVCPCERAINYRGMWITAISRYFTDCQSELCGSRWHDNGEALGDLTSADAPMLRRLCHYAGLDFHWVRAGIEARLDAQDQRVA